MCCSICATFAATSRAGATLSALNPEQERHRAAPPALCHSQCPFCTLCPLPASLPSARTGSWALTSMPSAPGTPGGPGGPRGPGSPGGPRWGKKGWDPRQEGVGDTGSCWNVPGFQLQGAGVENTPRGQGHPSRGSPGKDGEISSHGHLQLVIPCSLSTPLLPSPALVSMGDTAGSPWGHGSVFTPFSSFPGARGSPDPTERDLHGMAFLPHFCSLFP